MFFKNQFFKKQFFRNWFSENKCLEIAFEKTFFLKKLVLFYFNCFFEQNVFF